MQQTKYRPGSQLSEYEADCTVTDVPVTYFNDDRDAMEYFTKHRDNKAWKITTTRLEKEFDPVKFGEFFYCLKCKRMEDGAHRRVIAFMKAMKTVNVRIGGDCYKNYVKAGRLIRSDSTFIDTLTKLIRANPDRHRNDEKWLLASASDKWPFISKHVDFRGKSFLDVGCNVGYSVFRAWSLMADKVEGADIRDDVLDIGVKARQVLGASQTRRSGIFFSGRGAINRSSKFDIVMSMGMLHYMDISNYEKALDQLSGISNPKTLILELRLKKGRNDIALTTGSGGQTLPTEGWLQQKFESNGFKEIHKYNRAKDRALWIGKRG